MLASRSCFSLLHQKFALIFAVSICVSILSTPARANYILSPGNVVEISVYGVPDLQRKMTINSDGHVSLPLIGDVPVAGLTIAAAREKLRELLDRKGIVNNPDVSIVIVEYRPFYIFGDVDKPGEYPYRPNLTVLQAFTIAGGLQRKTEQRERDAIQAQGDLEVLSVQANYLVARRARLEAELSNAEAIDYPRDLKDKRNDPAIALVMQQEQTIFEARKNGYITQVRALEQLKGHLEKEIESLNSQLATEDTQLRLLNKELKSVSSLVEKGLAVTPRQLSLERTMAQIEGERLRLAAGVMRSRQEISKTDIAILELGNRRSNEIAVELRETQARLDEAVRKFDTSSQLLNEAEDLQSAARRIRTLGLQPTYTIMRQQGDRLTQIKATGATVVEPGDTIQVDVPLPATRTPPLVRSGTSLPSATTGGVRVLKGQPTQ
jgi:polysaccharide export outer membrane protein/exopolysaccharide production protein ExoF